MFIYVFIGSWKYHWQGKLFESSAMFIIYCLLNRAEFEHLKDTCSLVIYLMNDILRKCRVQNKTNANKRFRIFLGAESKFVTIRIFHQNIITKIHWKTGNSFSNKYYKI